MNQICIVLAVVGILGGLASAGSDWILGISKVDYDNHYCCYRACCAVMQCKIIKNEQIDPEAG